MKNIIKKKKKNNSKWIAFTSLFIIIGLILMGAFLALTHDYFKTGDDIVVKGNILLKDEEIIEKANISKENFFKLNTKNIENNIKQLDNIKSVKVEKLLPNKIVINVVEDADFAYVSVDKGYLIISSDLIVDRLEKKLSEEQQNKLIKIINASYDSLQIGAKITSSPREEEFLKTLIDKDLYTVTKEIDFGEAEDDVKLRVNSHTIISFGKLEDYDYKFSLIEKIIIDLKEKKISPKEIILKDTDNPIVVKD